MNKGGFLEKHPGAKDMILEPNGLVYNRKEPLMTINNIHQTQLDKQKAKETIENYKPVYGVFWKDQLIKELGLNTPDTEKEKLSTKEYWKKHHP